LGTLFPISRTALPFLVLFVVAILGILATYSGRVAGVIMTIGAFLLAFNFMVNYNLHQTRTWDFDRYDLIVMEKISKQTHTAKVTIGSYRMFHPVLDYYRLTKFSDKVSYVENVLEYEPKDTTFDYYYIYAKDLKHMTSKYEIDTVFDNKYALVRRK
jgi:predicted membrane protein